MEGSTRIGSFAANGIAPSEIPIEPMIAAALPASCSCLVNFFLNRNVASAMPRGGVQIAMPTPPISHG
ncbi:Uncharacterised protein [Vibrio cholerae]|nr:Uncharacterised protein [Vibrio cholerae]